MGQISHQPDTMSIILMWVVLGVFIIDATLLFAWLSRREAVSQGLKPPLFAPKWSVVDVWAGAQAVVILLLALLMPVVLIMLAFTLAKAGPHAGMLDNEKMMTDILVPVSVIGLIPQNALLAAVPFVFIIKKYKLSLKDIGLTLKPSRQDIIRGFSWGLAMMVLGIALQAGIQIGLAILLGEGRFHQLIEANKQFGNETIIKDALKSPILGVLTIIGGGILAPFGEEVFFRGFMFNAIKHRFGLWAGVIISGILFALVHGGPLLILAIIPFGMLLALAYHKTGSLWVPIIMHITNNSVQLLIEYFWPGRF
jgi:membrane protease YdiL (CAAX protease family)